MWNFRCALIAKIPDEAIQPGICRQSVGAWIALEGVFFIVCAFFFFLGKLADDFAGRVQNFQSNLRRLFLFLGFAFAGFVGLRLRVSRRAGSFFLVWFLERGFQPVINDCSGGRILSHVPSRSKKRATKYSVAGGGRREQVRLLLRHRLVVLFQRCDVVEHPETTSVSRDYKVVAMVV